MYMHIVLCANFTERGAYISNGSQRPSSAVPFIENGSRLSRMESFYSTKLSKAIPCHFVSSILLNQKKTNQEQAYPNFPGSNPLGPAGGTDEF